MFRNHRSPSRLSTTKMSAREHVQAGTSARYARRPLGLRPRTSLYSRVRRPRHIPRRRQRAGRAHHGLDTAYSTDSATEIRRTGAPDVGREFSVSARLVVVPTKRALPGWTLKRRTTNILFAFGPGIDPGYATTTRSRARSSLTYRASHTNHTRLADKRQAEAQRIRTKYPERIPRAASPCRSRSANRPRLSRAVRGGFCGGKTRGLF